ncbi:leucyl/phenylalanyl-tRNA--protein transferase [Hufsiella ginkgonis]|uniref:Leucyl/phenylalanyl-tRNA--protein transferase n=1 Tax=Hufsiella ginkgonis TaxID=2695274 RepID=A0A7K1XVE5_9SPHI|nr:leucyl/phenylalanyl-tRNA--protein transferase [Hufsiella ginkgonis]MXV14950.1 leucyl/phenylalanyl-tRNA--protein transferase [Hufsiella ginkgonis]
MIFQLDPGDTRFPSPELAEEDGLLAVGGDLSIPRLLTAYRNGIFPWYSHDTPVLWYSPHQRFVLFPEKLKVSKSMRNVLRSGKFTITFNQDFAGVIRACAASKRNGQDGTWITGDMQNAYICLHQQGFAHSVEAWENGRLAGGLYGVEMNGVFCGESMFSQRSNASKTAFITLVREKNYRLIDCQTYTEHLESLGAQMISRKEYMDILNGNTRATDPDRVGAT